MLVSGIATDTSADREVDPRLKEFARQKHTQTEELVKAREGAGKPVRYLQLPNHSHLSETYAVGTPDESLSAPVLEFVRQFSLKGR